MMGEAASAPSVFGIAGTGTGFGLASGGLPPEGMLYGHSYGYVLSQLLALQTAGFNNPAYSGAQIGLIGAPVWDRYVKGMLSSLVPVSTLNSQASWLGNIYSLCTYGDLLRDWVTPDFVAPVALLSLLENATGKSDHADAARWFAVNAVEGGQAGLYSRINDPWSYGTTDALLYFMLLDPTAGTPADPRQNLPTVFVDAPAGRVIAHTDYSPSASMFDYRASWNSINHQIGDGGMFELYRSGEWLTKELSNYDANFIGATTAYHNTLALQNWCANGTPNLGWFEGPNWELGSQWILGLNAGDPTTAVSSGPGYVFTDSNITNLYNRPSVWTPSNSVSDISQATRSILWLNGDYTVVYDRAVSVHSGLFKRFNLCLPTNPVTSGSLTTETLASGQKLFINTLLPKAPAISTKSGIDGLSTIALLTPMQWILTVEDPTHAASTRFLHVLQGANPGAFPAKAAYIQSASGTAFEGAAVNGAAVYFPVNTVTQIATTAFVLPANTSTVYIMGLNAQKGYTVSAKTTSGVTTVTIAVGGTSVADAAGMLRIVMQ